MFSSLCGVAGIGQWSSIIFGANKSAVNCAQSSSSGWVTSWSRQRAGIGDLLSTSGITCQRYTDWSHNKLTKHPPPWTQTQAQTHPLPKPLVSEGSRELVKGHLSSTVYFPAVNCVIAHGSVGRRSSDRVSWPPLNCGRQAELPFTPTECTVCVCTQTGLIYCHNMLLDSHRCRANSRIQIFILKTFYSSEKCLQISFTGFQEFQTKRQNE